MIVEVVVRRLPVPGVVLIWVVDVISVSPNKTNGVALSQFVVCSCTGRVGQKLFSGDLQTGVLHSSGSINWS